MKTIIFAAALLFSGVIASAQNGASMEFKVSSNKGVGGTINVKYSEFGTKSESSMMGMNMVSLTKKESPDVVYMINDKDKTYREMKKSTSQPDDNSTYTVKKIGNETINGYKCVHALVTDNRGTTDMWTTKDFADYNKYSESLNNNRKLGSAKREQALKDAGCEGFPVKMVTKEKDGDMTMELTKLEKKSFSKSDFEVPAGYTKAVGPGGTPPGKPAGIKSQEELMKMTPEERAKYAEELKKQYGKGN
jgi:hypothetical protein